MENLSINWTPIIIGVIAFAVGYIFAMLDRRVTGAIKKKNDEKEVRILEDQSAFSISFNEQQAMQIKLAGAKIFKPEDVTPDQRRQLISLLNQLRPWLEAGPAAPVSVPQQPSSAGTRIAHLIIPEPGKKVDAKEPPAPPTSIVGQIDEVLKKRIAGTPMEGRLRLTEGPDGAVEVWVGGKRYEGIDAVPEAEQVLIRAAIKEWEKGPQ